MSSVSPPSGLLARVLPLSRPQAFCLHLTVSLLAFSTLVFAMLTFWFPGKLFLIDGGWQGLKLVAMVDLVLGPLLTLVLYKPGKPKLALDMSLIAAIQIAALGYGFVATWQQRTVAVVFADGAFNTLSGAALRAADEQLLEHDIEPRTIASIAAGRAPLLVTPPPDKGNFGTYLEELFNGFPEPHERSDKFVNAETAQGTLARSALSLDELQGSTREAVERALAKLQRAPDSIRLLRFKARYANGIALYDPADNRVLDWIEAEPSLAAATPAGSPPIANGSND